MFGIFKKPAKIRAACAAYGLNAEQAKVYYASVVREKMSVMRAVAEYGALTGRDYSFGDYVFDTYVRQYEVLEEMSTEDLLRVDVWLAGALTKKDAEKLHAMIRVHFNR